MKFVALHHILEISLDACVNRVVLKMALYEQKESSGKSSSVASHVMWTRLGLE